MYIYSSIYLSEVQNNKWGSKCQRLLLKSFYTCVTSWGSQTSTVQRLLKTLGLHCPLLADNGARKQDLQRKAKLSSDLTTSQVFFHAEATSTTARFGRSRGNRGKQRIGAPYGDRAPLSSIKISPNPISTIRAGLNTKAAGSSSSAKLSVPRSRGLVTVPPTEEVEEGGDKKEEGSGLVEGQKGLGEVVAGVVIQS